MVGSPVVSALERPTEVVRPPAASSKLDLHAWVAIGCATLFACGITTLAIVAYLHVP